jgi:PhnB protein
VTHVTVQGFSAHLFVEDAEAAASFYRRTLGAVEVFRNRLPDGRLLFVELAIGPARLMLSEPFPELDAVPRDASTPLPLLLHLDVDEPDAVVERMVLLGADVEQPVAEQFWGERYGVVRDPFGFRWSISTSRQVLTPDEMEERTPQELTRQADDRNG